MDNAAQDYIRRMKQAGQTDDQIRASLKQAGWTDAQVRGVLPDRGSGMTDKMVVIIIVALVVLAGGGVGAYYWLSGNGTDSDSGSEGDTEDSKTILVDLSTDRLAVMYERTVSIVDRSGDTVDETEIYRFFEEDVEFRPYTQGTRELLTDGKVLFVVYGDRIDKIDFDGNRLARWDRPKTDWEKEQEARNANRSSRRDTRLSIGGRLPEAETASHQLAQVDISGFYGGGGGMISAAILHGSYLFVSANGNFIVMDKDFRLKAQVDLEVGKNADDILVYDDHALLVDNIWEPFYVIAIDVSEPEAPRGVAWHGHGDVNSGLGDQWVDADGNWYVVGSYGHMGGWGSWISRFRPASYENDRPYQTIDYDDVDGFGGSSFGKETLIAEGSSYGEDNSDARGYYISADLNRAEDYFVIQDVQNRSLALSRIDDRYKLVDPLSLESGEDYYGGVSMHRIGEEVILGIGKKIIFIDDSGDAPVIADEQTQVDVVVDVVPLP